MTLDSAQHDAMVILAIYSLHNGETDAFDYWVVEFDLNSWPCAICVAYQSV